MLNRRLRFWLIFLPLLTMWSIVATDHHLSLWWSVPAGIIFGQFSHLLAD